MRSDRGTSFGALRRPRPRDHALRLGAESLRELGSDASLDVRRAEAFGDLVRRQLALDLGQETSSDALPVARQLDLHVPLAATVAADTGEVTLDRLARLDEGQRQVLLEQVKEWCADSHTRVVVRPVLDLATHLTAPGYHMPEPGVALWRSPMGHHYLRDHTGTRALPDPPHRR